MDEIKEKEGLKKRERRTEEKLNSLKEFKASKDQSNGKFGKPEGLKEIKINFHKKSINILPFDHFLTDDMLVSNAGRKVTSIFSTCNGKVIILSFTINLHNEGKNIMIKEKFYPSILIYLTIDLKLNKKSLCQSIYPLDDILSSHKIIDRDIESHKDKSRHIAAITNNGAFVMYKLDTPSQGLCNIIELYKVQPSDDKLSCFEIISNQANQCLRLFAGSHAGKIYIYDIIEKPKIIRIINSNVNFYVKSLKLYKFTKNEGTDSQILISIATLDGYIKIFNIRDPEPLYEFVSAKKPVYDLFWDPNPTLLFFLDESEPKAINVISFNRNPTIADYAKKLIKNPINLLRLDMDHVSDYFGCFCGDGTVRVGLIPVN